jgi:hypothetical protein
LFESRGGEGANAVEAEPYRWTDILYYSM